MPLVELVSVQTRDGVRLDGTLRQPLPSVPPSIGVDLAILHHGTGGNFYTSGVLAEMQESLLQSGCSVLRVNSRGHDMSYDTPQGRMGAAYEIVDDCRVDWKAWLDFAEARRFQRILLWGFSLGALKTMYYLAKEQDNRVKRAVASSPPRFSYSGYLARDGSTEFQRDYKRARELLDSGEPDGIIDASLPMRVLQSARVFIDKYGPEERYDFLALLPRVTVPLLVTIGSLEGTVPTAPFYFAFDGLSAPVADFAGASGIVSFVPIPGADHLHVGKYKELWGVARDWLVTLAST